MLLEGDRDADSKNDEQCTYWLVYATLPFHLSSVHTHEECPALKVPFGAPGDSTKNKMVVLPLEIYELKQSSGNLLSSL